MELHELKSSWQKSGSSKKSSEELAMMTRIRNHPKMKRITIKLLIEVILLIALVIFYNDLFDGGNKPLWINGLLIGSAVLFIMNDVLGFIFMMDPVKENNIKHSLSVLYFKLKRLALFSIMSSLFFGTSVILFFTSVIQFTNSKYFMLAGMVITMLIMIFLSYKNWAQRIGYVKRMLLEFEGVL